MDPTLENVSLALTRNGVFEHDGTSAYLSVEERYILNERYDCWKKIVSVYQIVHRDSSFELHFLVILNVYIINMLTNNLIMKYTSCIFRIHIYKVLHSKL